MSVVKHHVGVTRIMSVVKLSCRWLHVSCRWLNIMSVLHVSCRWLNYHVGVTRIMSVVKHHVGVTRIMSVVKLSCRWLHVSYLIITVTRDSEKQNPRVKVIPGWLWDE